MRVAWLVLPRTGSQFLVKLTTSLLGQALNPHSSLTPGRREKGLPGLLTETEREGGFRRCAAAGAPEGYFAQHGAQSVKIERPFADDLPQRLAAAHPQCRFLASIRSFRQVAASHEALSWGMPADQLLTVYTEHVAAIAAFSRMRSVLFVDVERLMPFDAVFFADWLGAPPTRAFTKLVEHWPIVNSLNDRIARDGARQGAITPVTAEMLAAGEALDLRLRGFAARNNARLLRKWERRAQY